MTVHVAGGSTRTGLWCDACALPSLIEWDLHMLRSNDVMTVGTVSVCTECYCPDEAQ